MVQQGLSAIVANAENLGLVQKSEINAGQDDKAALREYQLHATQEMWSYIPSARGNIPERPKRPFVNAKSSSKSLKKRREEQRTTRLSKDVLLLLVESAGRLNQAQAQMEYRKALKEQAQTMKKNGQPYEAEVLDDIVHGVMPPEIQQLVEAEERAISQAKQLSDQTGGRRVMHKLPTLYRNMQAHIMEVMGGKQAHQRWGYFGGLQHFLPPAGVNGLGVNGTEAEAVQAIVNPDAEKVTSASAKRPESLSNDNWWTIVQKRKKATLYSQKLAEYRERMETYKQQYAARYIQRSWRAWKYSRTMDASDELNMIRTEIARRKKMEAALRAAAEGAWHLAGNQRRLVARQHTYKRPVGFGSSMDSRRLTYAGDDEGISRPLSRADIPFSYSRRQTGAGLERLPSFYASRNMRRSGFGSGKSMRMSVNGGRSMRQSMGGLSQKSVGKSSTDENNSSQRATLHEFMEEEEEKERSEEREGQASTQAPPKRRPEVVPDMSWRTRRLGRSPSVSEPGTGMMLEDRIEEGQEDLEGIEEEDERGAGKEGASQDDGEQASGFGKQARQKRSVAWRASIMGSQASRSGQSSRQDPLACGVDLDASHSNLIVKHKSGRLARRSPPLDVPSPPRPPPSAPANCTAPLDACVPLFRKPKQHMPSGNQGPECKGIQPRSRSGSDDGDVHNNGGGVQESGTIGDQDSAAGGIQDGDAEHPASECASSSAYDSCTYGGSTTQEDEQELEEGDDGEEEEDDWDEGYVTADEEDLAQPPMRAAVLAWELERALKAGNRVKADSLRERAAAAAAAAEEMVAAMAAAAAAREAEIAAAKAERARARSAHAIAIAKQQLEGKGATEEGSHQLSVEATCIGGVVGSAPKAHSTRSTGGKGELVKGRTRHRSAGAQSRASGDNADVPSMEISFYGPVGLEAEGSDLAWGGKSGSGRSGVSGAPVHIQISKPLNSKRDQPLEDFGAVKVPPSEVPEFPEPLTPPPSPFLSFARASGRNSGSRAATIEELKRVSSRPSIPDTPDHPGAGDLEGIQGQHLKASALELQRILEQRRLDERALVKRLYPTGWQNVGDMCILEKDGDEVTMPQEGVPIFTENVYSSHPQVDLSHSGGPGVGSRGNLILGPGAKWQGHQVDERFNVQGVGVGAGARAEGGARNRWEGHQGSGAEGAGGPEGDPENDKGSGVVEGDGKGHAGLTLKGERLDTDMAGLQQHPQGAGRRAGEMAGGSSMSSGQMAKLQAQQAVVARAVARHTAHHARHGALAVAHGTFRPVPAHLTRFPPQFKLDEEEVSASRSSAATGMVPGSPDPARSSGPDNLQTAAPAVIGGGRGHAGVGSKDSRTAQPHGLPGSPHGLPGSPHGLPGSPHGLPGSPHGLPGSPHGFQGSPHGLPGSPHGLQGSPHGLQGSPHGFQGSTQGSSHQHTGGGEHGGACADRPSAGWQAGTAGQQPLQHPHQHTRNSAAGSDAQNGGPLQPQGASNAHTAHPHGAVTSSEANPAGIHNNSASGAGRHHVIIPGDLLTDAQVSNVYGVPPSNKDVQFEVLYGLTRLSQAPPSSPKAGVPQGQLIELQIQGQEDHQLHLSPDHASSPRAKAAEHGGWSSDDAFTAALMSAAHQLKGVGQKASGRRGVRVRVLDPGLQERVGWVDGQQGGEGSGQEGEGEVGLGAPQEVVQAVNLGEGEMEGAGPVGAAGLVGGMGRQARKRTKIEAAKQGNARGGGGLQIGGTGWVAGPNGYAIRQPIGQEAAHELEQNLGVRRVQLQTRALLPPRCLPRFRQRKEGQAMSLRVRDGTELNAVLLPKRRSAGQESLQGNEGAQAREEDPADSHLTKGQRQQRYRSRQHELWRKGFRVVRAQRWGGGTRPHLRAMMMGPARRLLIEAQQEVEALERKARALEPKAGAALLGRMLTSSLGNRGRQNEEAPPSSQPHSAHTVPQDIGDLHHLQDGPHSNKGQQQGQPELGAFGKQLQLQQPLVWQFRELHAQAQALAMDPRSAYSPHYLKLAERYPELLLPYPAHGKATANSGIASHTGSPGHLGLGTLTPLASGGHVGYGGLAGDRPSWESIHTGSGGDAARKDGAYARDPGSDWGPQAQAQHGGYTGEEGAGKGVGGGGPRHPTTGTSAQAEHPPYGSPMRIVSHPQGGKSGGVAGLGGLVRGARGPISTASLLQLSRGSGKLMGPVNARNHWAPPHKADVEGMLVLGRGSGTHSPVPQAQPQPPHGGYGGGLGGGRPTGGGLKFMGGGALVRGSTPSIHTTSAPLPVITEHQRTSFMPHTGSSHAVAAAAPPAHFAHHHPTSPPAAYAHAPHGNGLQPKSPPDRGSSIPALPHLLSAPHPPSSVQAALHRHQQATQQPTRPAGYTKGGRVWMGSTSRSQPLPPSKQLAPRSGAAVYASAEGLGARQDLSLGSPPRQVSPPAHR